MLDVRVKAFVAMMGQRKAKSGGGKMGAIAASCGFKSLEELRDFLDASPLDKAAVEQAGIKLDAVVDIGHRNTKEVVGRNCSIPQASEPEPDFGGIDERDILVVEKMLKLGAPFRTAAARVGLREATLRKACLESEALTERLLIAESKWSEEFFTNLQQAMAIASADGNLKPFLDVAATRFPDAYAQVTAMQVTDASKARRLAGVDNGVQDAEMVSKPLLIISAESEE